MYGVGIGLTLFSRLATKLSTSVSTSRSSTKSDALWLTGGLALLSAIWLTGLDGLQRRRKSASGR